jgi:pyruvate dehydrogenase E1 component alpha subunit
MSLDEEQRGLRTEMLEEMIRIRTFEERVRDLFADNELPGFVHLYIGQEAVASGACATIDADDYITSTHRGHGHAIAKGLDTDRMMAELFGKETGYCGGKSGSMHIADVDRGMLGANGIVGAGPNLAIGAGLTIQQNDSDRVCLSFFGEGAMAEGKVHEAMNMAGVMDLPVVFICENNQYGEMTPAEDQHHVEGFADRGDVYGMTSEQIDGMDPEAVYESVDDAVERARDGEGPSLIVCDTYRYRGHYEGDPESYRDEAELEEWKERDPISTLADRLVNTEVIDREDVDELRAAAESEIDDAVSFARESDLPDPETASEGVYTEDLS